MAELDDGAKTEQPTERRLRQGRERGQVAVSQEVKSWGVLTACALALSFLVPGACRDLGATLKGFLERAESFSVEARAGAGLDLLLEVGSDVAPIIGLLCLFAAGVSLAQVGFLWAPSRISASLDRLSPLQGLGRLFGLTALMEFGKGLLKIATVSAVFVAIAHPLLQEITLYASLSPLGVLERLHHLALILVAGTAAVMTVIAAADYGVQRLMFLQRMRMSKQEVRDEYRETEGDPQIKARIRRLRAERARRRMMTAVPEADVVITNPTHYAVALKYDMETMAAPKMLAKGADLLAQKIRELAKNHEVPIIENPPLARALYGAVEIDQEIPPEQYEAVARVISYVMQLKRRGG